MKPIAIIGAGGFVGTRMLETLVLEGQVGARAIVRSYRNMASLCRFGSAIDVKRANAERLEELAAALEGVETAVNVTTGPPAGIVRSTTVIHDACLRAGVKRLVHLSSAVVYGDVHAPITDDAPPLAKHWMPYARAKGAAEVWLRQQLGRSPLDIVVLRPGIVWGVRSPHTTDIARSLCARQAYLVGEGQGVFNGVYVDNLVAAIRAAAGHAGPAAGFYNVGDTETVTWAQFYRALGGPLGCDVRRLPLVSASKFPHSIGSVVDTIQNLPLVNGMYHRLKVYIPDGAKAVIRASLEGDYSYDRFPVAYATAPGVSRELWHLQQVRHKLPTARFASNFGFSNPVSFDRGIAKTVAWLGTMGRVAPGFVAPVAAG